MAIQTSAAFRAMAPRLATAIHVTSLRHYPHSFGLLQKSNDQSQCLKSPLEAPMTSELNSECPYQGINEPHSEILHQSEEGTVVPHDLEMIREHHLSHQIKEVPSDAELLNMYRGWILTVTH